MEQNLERRIKTLTDNAHRYWILLERTRQDLECQPDNLFLQMRLSVLEEDLDFVLNDIESLWRQLSQSPKFLIGKHGGYRVS